MEGIDKIRKVDGRPAYDRSMTDLVWGFNHRQLKVPEMPLSDTDGFSFYTRPELNLSYDNIKNVPEFDFLHKGGPYSMGAVIRAYLDPISSADPSCEAYTPLVDPQNPFIPILTNLINDFSGAPDIENPYWSSDPGRFDEQYLIPNGISGVYNIWESNATFRNVRGDPITALFFVWVTYINRVAENSMKPWFRNLVEDEMDSFTRHYRFITDETRTRFTKNMCSIASLPTGSTIGSSFDQNSQRPYTEANKEVAVPFVNIGAYYLSTRVVDDFNTTVINFNSGMKPSSDGVISRMRRLSRSELKLFNWRGVPRLKEDQTIEWYVSDDTYEQLMREYILENPNDQVANNNLRKIINNNLVDINESHIASLRKAMYKDIAGRRAEEALAADGVDNEQTA
jgi:hypothetical protein